jgi:signal transduction histidine kinase
MFYGLAILGLNWLGTLLNWLVAAILILHKPLDRVALILAVGFIVLPTHGSVFALWRAHPALVLSAQFILFVNYASLVPLYSLFPDGRWVPRWSRWVALAMVAYNFLFFFFVFPVPDDSAWVRFNNLRAPLAFIYMACIQVYRYRRVSNAAQRQQTKWVVFGFVCAMLVALIWSLTMLFVSSTPVALIQSLAPFWSFPFDIFLTVSFAIAILRYRLFDIDLLINRTLVYGALTAFVVSAYALVVGTVGALLRVEGNIVLSLIATGLVAIAFNPLRERLQRAVNRLMYGERDDPYAVLSRFGQRLEMTLASNAILPTIVETITQTLKLPYAALRLNNATTIIYGALPPNTQPESFPLVYQSEIIGQLDVAPRAVAEAFTPAERRLLTDLAHQAGVAAHAARLTADLQQARERLVTTREEERRRLRRDLHDGLGPKLAGQALILEAVRDALVPDSPSHAWVNHLIADSQSVVSEIRELVQGLRPPALDEFGLVGAVRALAAQCEAGQLRVTVTAPDPMPPLPAAVEVAVYRIAQEALTNIVKHAQATECQVRLAFGDSTLRLDVQDNGLGLPATRRPGVGLSSMRERAEEIGGHCVIEAGIDGGTCVTAQLPITNYQ